ncbi:AP-3 complex subunit delta [Cinnamomum micranthum f. kanehirae]|uniref:AP-3 complex subunit delta n=1 Tax=Cinnamomum micranthum f. kanehirae TaxID=337451 RepID=A0A3S3R3D9_9MAGN|nr:AP-3 complex subunit delta [Cinnamomum micranthum f. kanehirae]
MTSSPSIMESFFQRSLDDLIKSLRSPLLSSSPSHIISKSLDDIRRELRSTDPATKSVALQKLTYLSSLHSVDMSFAAFPVVELLSSPRFPHKKIAYLAASLSFHPTTDVLLLIPNQLRKDLNSPNPFESSLPLEFLSVAATPDLARELTPEIFTLLSSTKTHVKKRAISVIHTFFNLYPDSVRVAFKRLVENLDGSDPTVVSTAIGVFCELASKDPRSYLPLAPEFYRILVDSKNNWILIKVVKIFGQLVPLEPRLAKRVVDPICEHMRRTGAKSLIFECVRMIVSSLADYESAVRLAVEKIHEFLVDEDPNLRYLGLNVLSILSSVHLWAVIENKEAIIKSLCDADPNIQLAALRLVMAMVSDENIAEISRVLMNYAVKSDPEFCNEILASILSTCGSNVYELIVDFDWYVSILGEMSRNPHCRMGEEIERQIVDIGIRVKDARPELVRVGRDLLIDPALLGNPLLHHILSAAAWVSGEYIEFSKNPLELMEALLQPRANLLPLNVRAVYIQSAFKVLVFTLNLYFMECDSMMSSSVVDLLPGVSDSVPETHCLEDCNSAECKVSVEDVKLSVENDDGAVTHSILDNVRLTCESITCMWNLIKPAMELLSASEEVEIQERAHNVLGLIHMLQEIPGFLIQNEVAFERIDPKATELVKLMLDAFSEELGPVPMNAQEKVPIPDGLTLDENLSKLDSVFGDDLPFSHGFSILGHQHKDTDGVPRFNLMNKEELEPLTESTSLLAQHRKRHGLYYLPTENEPESNDYPPANNDLQSLVNLVDAAEDLVKLTEPSKKPNRAKPRPVVIKLDEGNEVRAKTAKSMKDSKDDLISGVVRDILLGDGSKPISSQKSTSNKPPHRRVNEEGGSSSTKSKEKVVDTKKLIPGSPSSRKSRHRSSGKEKSKSSQDNKEKDGKRQESSRQNTHNDRRHKTRHRADGPMNVVPQTPVIQDFLL